MREVKCSNPEEYIEAIETWRHECPVRIFMVNHDQSFRNMGSLLGVSYLTVQNWARGATYPNADNWKMIKAIGITKEEYDAWLDAKPTIKMV